MHGAGRTDAGVHALAQVAHVDLPASIPTDTIRSALNHFLRPAAISVLAVEAAAPDFDARRSATGRVYRYRILNRRAAADARPQAGLACRAAARPRGDAGGRARTSSASTISRPFATRCARRNRRSRRSTRSR